MLNVLVFVGTYLPGCKSGGPVQALANMVARLGSEFKFSITTADRDSGDAGPYEGIRPDSWNKVGKAEVFYMSEKRRSLPGFRRILNTTPHDVLYLNSFFSYFTVKPLVLRKLGLTPAARLVLAPRGEFSPGAMAIKGFKKRVYMTMGKVCGLFKDIFWQASSDHEADDIRRQIGPGAAVIVAPDLTAPQLCQEKGLKKEKTKNRLKLVFLSRICRMKNLDAALKMVEGLEGEVFFDIYGPIEDEAYWRCCQKLMSSFKENIQVRYRGVVSHQQVAAVMEDGDFFILPTRGENFGHAILEALSAGCPVLISDRTPWRGLAKARVGWDFPLEEPEKFREALRACLAMDNVIYQQWSQGARAFAQRVIQDETMVARYRCLFQETGEKTQP